MITIGSAVVIATDLATLRPTSLPLQSDLVDSHHMAEIASKVPSEVGAKQ